MNRFKHGFFLGQIFWLVFPSLWTAPLGLSRLVLLSTLLILINIFVLFMGFIRIRLDHCLELLQLFEVLPKSVVVWESSLFALV